ncbi:MAG: class I SAM-dependent methyltransferase [Nitrospirae bacterium]|nr:class I SAM-dependent methyltransferase [Nitrospirota bacterium]
MDEISKEYVISFFDKRLLLHGDRPEAVGWSSKGQILRHQAMLDVGDINNNKILDFGCGKGDFYNFLEDSGIKAKYSGFDINEKLIRLAKKKYPDIDFRVFDIDKDILDEDFDFIFLCGVFNLQVEGIDETIKKTLTKLFQHCNTALVINALSSHEPNKDFELHYMCPEEIINFAVKKLSPYVSLRHDRIPSDFTMFVYRDINRFPTDR